MNSVNAGSKKLKSITSQRAPESANPSQPQFERFVETASALGCDEDKERFEKQLGKIAAHKPKNAVIKNPTLKKKRT